MKFDICVKNIRNMKLNGYIFKIHTQAKKEINKKFEKFLSKLVWKETLFHNNLVCY